MKDSRPTYTRRSTRPIPRIELAPISSSRIEVEEAPITMMPCPCCSPHGGQGLVSAECRAELLRDHHSAVVSDRTLVMVDDPGDEPPPKAA